MFIYYRTKLKQCITIISIYDYYFLILAIDLAQNEFAIIMYLYFEFVFS